jgi:hypothetical protein
MIKERAVTGLETLVFAEPSLVLPRVHEHAGYDLALVCRSCGDRWLLLRKATASSFPDSGCARAAVITEVPPGLSPRLTQMSRARLCSFTPI